MAVGKLSFLLSKDLLVGALVSEGEHHTHVNNLCVIRKSRSLSGFGIRVNTGFVKRIYKCSFLFLFYGIV